MTYVAGIIIVSGDGTYSAEPELGPFAEPGKATSYAQAMFEQEFPVALSVIAEGMRARVQDISTKPPTTVKGSVMQRVAAEVNARAAAAAYLFR